MRTTLDVFVLPLCSRTHPQPQSAPSLPRVTHTLRFSVTSVVMISVCNVIIADCITIIVESSREIGLMEPLGLDLARFTVGPPGRDSLRV